MKLYYIATPEAMKVLPIEWHSLPPLDDGRLLVVIRWKDEAMELEWSKRIDVEALPHPIFEATKPLQEDHIRIFAKQHPVKQGDTIHDLIKHVSKTAPLFRLHVL